MKTKQLNMYRQPNRINNDLLVNSYTIMFVLEFKFSYTLIQRNGNINIDK